jgi:type II secretory pathway pseudopilin PulG
MLDANGLPDSPGDISLAMREVNLTLALAPKVLIISIASQMSSPFCKRRRSSESAFTLAEVLIAIAVCVMFGAAAFATNERLLIALKSQKETTAATMVLQQRMETFRATAFSNIGTASYVQANIVASPTGSEAPLGNLTETVTVSKYVGDPAVGSGTNTIVRDSSNPSGTITSTNGNLKGMTWGLLRVDILLSWTGANGRTRSRQLSSLFGIGNIAP